MRALRAIYSAWRLDGPHVLAVLCPPLAVRAAGRSDMLPLSILLTLLLWVPGVVHALWVVSVQASNARAHYLVAALRSHIGH
jgi:uncharacterized membrane protein YqaE (UPF0057 family)